MEITIPYDGKSEVVDFPANTEILRAPRYNPLPRDSVISKIKNAWERNEHLYQNKRISIIVNDATRRVPTSDVLRILEGLIPFDNSEILVATGTHRPPEDHQLGTILGEFRGKFDGRIFVHDCRDEKNMLRIGETSLKTPVVVNRRLAEAESVICINSVEPHFFAGFTGGRKSLVPGMAGFETVVANHSHAKSEYAESLNLENNPVHLDLQEAFNMAATMPVFSIQLILSREGQILDLFCGEMPQSFSKACEMAVEVYTISIKKRFDVVFAIGEPPLDANLYQLQKAQEHGGRAVRNGGLLIVVGACQEGVGSPYFLELTEDYPDSADALSDRAMNDDRFGIHKLVKTARRLREIKIRYITKLDDKVIEKLYFEPVKNIGAALAAALAEYGPSCETAVLMDACFLVPVVV